LGSTSTHCYQVDIKSIYDGNLTHWTITADFAAMFDVETMLKPPNLRVRSPKNHATVHILPEPQHIYGFPMVSLWFPYGFSYGFPMFDWAFPMVSRVKNISISPRCAPSKTALQAFGMERVLWWAWTIQRPDAGERDGLGPWWLVHVGDVTVIYCYYLRCGHYVWHI